MRADLVRDEVEIAGSMDHGIMYMLGIIKRNENVGARAGCLILEEARQE